MVSRHLSMDAEPGQLGPTQPDIPAPESQRGTLALRLIAADGREYVQLPSGQIRRAGSVDVAAHTIGPYVRPGKKAKKQLKRLLRKQLQPRGPR